MYYGARYYDSAIGRFTQPDTIVPHLYNPQSLNRYAYGLNNPVKYVDPTGHAPVELDENGNEFIDYSWRARQRAFDETGVIIIGRATNFEINIVREIASIFPPLSSGDVKSPVVIISSVRSKDLGMVEITPGPRFGIATIYKKEILACALARDCGDYTGVPYETQFKRWTAHELAHKAALNDPRLKAAYDKIFNSDPQGGTNQLGLIQL